jgi:spoIIIJ-associated protein
VENYKERRHAHLEREAKSAASKVVETGKEIVLEPMPAGDRKIIHNLLESFEGVRTYSRGPEGQRQVIVAPQQKEANDLMEPSGNTG